MVEDIRNFTLKELEQRFRNISVEPYRATQVFEWLYKHGAEDFASMTNIGPATRQLLERYFFIERLHPEKIETSRDLTQKFLFKLADGSLIESVSIPFKSHLTACLSTQVGCRYGCAFCESGSLGFKRNLSVAEIVGQLVAIRKNVPEGRVSHVVFMGVGEPLDNYDNLLRAVRIINERRGINLGIRKMTVSTCGLVPGIERLAQEGLEIELSVSLHSALDEKRGLIVPVNRRYPLAALQAAVHTFIEKTHRKVTFEYVLLGGFNVGPDDAVALAKFMRHLNAKVNLIPYNATHGRSSFEEPTKLEVLFFKSYLTKHGLDVTLRKPRGTDITAACGQLRARTMRTGD